MDHERAFFSFQSKNRVGGCNHRIREPSFLRARLLGGFWLRPHHSMLVVLARDWNPSPGIYITHLSLGRDPPNSLDRSCDCDVAPAYAPKFQLPRYFLSSAV
jgi:hypothetical protein